MTSFLDLVMYCTDITPGSYLAKVASVTEARSDVDLCTFTIEYKIACLDGSYVNRFSEVIVDTLRNKAARELAFFMVDHDVDSIFDLIGATLIVDFDLVPAADGKLELAITHRNLFSEKGNDIVQDPEQ